MSKARASLLAFALALAPALVAAQTVNVVTVSGGINPAVADHIVQAIDRSVQDGAAALVIELDTPGGLLSSTKDIVNAILNAELPVIVFVSPRGAWAASAGTFITLAGHVAAMAPGTSIGAAHPVSFVPGAPPPPNEKKGDDKKAKEPPPFRDIAGEKIENFTTAFIESIAEVRKRNVKWAAEAVRNSVAITQSQALEKKVIDLIADDLDHLLEQVDGRKVEVGRESVALRTKDASIERIPMELINRFFDVISDPQIALLLILAGLLGLYVEFTQPGMIFPGVAGVVCLLLGGLALQIIPFNWLGLILIASGIALFAAEIFVPSFGALFVGGLVCMGLGAYLLFDVPEQSDLVVPFWRVIFPALLGIALFGGLVVFGLSRSLFRPQVAGLEALLGTEGVVDTASGTRARVSIRGELWTAETEEPISQGERVKIVGVDGLVLRVARAKNKGERNA